MPANQLEDIAVDSTVQVLTITEVDQSLQKSLFVINQGPDPVTIVIYGSPTGVTINQFMSMKSGVSQYTQAEIDLHYIQLVSQVVAADNNLYIGLSDYIYNYFKVTAQTISGTATINYAFQKASKLE